MSKQQLLRGLSCLRLQPSRFVRHVRSEFPVSSWIWIDGCIWPLRPGGQGPWGLLSALELPAGKLLLVLKAVSTWHLFTYIVSLFNLMILWLYLVMFTEDGHGTGRSTNLLLLLLLHELVNIRVNKCFTFTDTICPIICKIPTFSFCHFFISTPWILVLSAWNITNPSFNPLGSSEKKWHCSTHCTASYLHKIISAVKKLKLYLFMFSCALFLTNLIWFSGVWCDEIVEQLIFWTCWIPLKPHHLHKQPVLVISIPMINTPMLLKYTEIIVMRDILYPQGEFIFLSNMCLFWESWQESETSLSHCFSHCRPPIMWIKGLPSVCKLYSFI